MKLKRTVGYSGTPLAQKLGIKKGSLILTLEAPDEYSRLLEPLPSGVRFANQPSLATDIAHVFVTRKDELQRHLFTLRKRLKPEAALWVSWPKKMAKLPTDVTEDIVRDVALPLGFVDIKVCAVSDVWSGLKLVVRKELR